MKYMFRHMSSKNSKTRSACLQTLDLMVVKRLLIEKNAAFPSAPTTPSRNPRRT